MVLWKCAKNVGNTCGFHSPWNHLGVQPANRKSPFVLGSGFHMSVFPFWKTFFKRVGLLVKAAWTCENKKNPSRTLCFMVICAYLEKKPRYLGIYFLPRSGPSKVCAANLWKQSNKKGCYFCSCIGKLSLMLTYVLCQITMGQAKYARRKRQHRLKRHMTLLKTLTTFKGQLWSLREFCVTGVLLCSDHFAW